ncbi:substrate-binding domain-containing protein [Pelotomaculum propionicicum]|uniref:substrate-binding domain-containing protein n=1 Tax=Pelotomaculum propionicicum TaxID=258475 RepID=UPI003B7A5ADB
MSIKITAHKLMLILIIIISIAFLYGCARKAQPQKKPVNNGGGQEVKIAVSFADMERDGNQIIKNTMSARQGGQGQGQQGGQQNGQQGGQSQQAGLDVVPVQTGQNGAQGQGQQGGQQSGQGQLKVSITWLDAKNDSAQQEKDIDQLLSQNVKAVILQLVDPAAGSRIVRRLAQANIKVIALETLPIDSPVDGYITTDHARTGELQARYLISAAQGRAAALKTVILQGDKNDRVSTDIASSILQYLKGQSQVQVVLVKDHPRGDPQMAASTLEQVLASTGGGIDAVVATDSRMAAAAADLLKNRGLSERVITVGVGADQKSSRSLAAGDHDAEVDVMPELIAQYAYDAAVGLAATGYWQNDSRIRNGDFDVPAKTTPVRLITRSESYLLEQRWGQAQGQNQGQQGGQQGGQQNSQQNSQQGGQQNGQQGDQQNGQNSQNSQSGGQNQNSGGGSAGKKTTLRVTTQDGKTVEVQINGEIKKIETIDGAGGAGGQGGGAGTGSGQGGSGS